jgi:hypothetical protein
MHNLMTMPRDPYRTTYRRRPDGLVQIRALPAPTLSLGAFRSLGLGVIGATLLVAALVAAPFWLAWGARHSTPGRAGARAASGATVTDLGQRQR